jgi:glutathione peroxidase
MSDFFDVDLVGLNGAELDPDQFAGRAVLVVNVASRCGMTPQYEGLERLHRRYHEQGFSVLGAPCNQFANQEPEGEEQIREFCSTTYGTTFPLTGKLDVNGSGRHPMYRKLVETPDAAGRAGDIDWNFEKFLVSAGGEVVARFRPGVDPESDEVLAAIEATLASPEPRLAERWETVSASEVRVGDRVRPREGVELTVTRIESPFPLRAEMLAFVEATDGGWLKVPAAADSTVEVQRRLG